MKRFPESFNFSNEHGLTFTRREINDIAADLLEQFSPQGLEFGLELTYLILWAVNISKCKTTVYALIATVFRRVVKCKLYSGRRSTLLDDTDDLDEAIVDAESLGREERLLMYLDFESIFGRTDSLKELQEMDRRRRSERLEQMRKKVEEKYGRN